MAKFNQYLHKIANKVDVNHDEQHLYANDFKVISDYVFGIMCAKDKIFAQIFYGWKTFGSHANNIRTGCPDEFDVYMVLQFPRLKHLSVDTNRDWPGYIYLNFKNVYTKNDDLMDHIKCMTQNDNTYLNRRLLKTWLHRLLQQSLNTYGTTVRGKYKNCYELSYAWRGVTYTVTATSPERTFSIDLVPAVMYRSNNSEWYAVPKNTPRVGDLAMFTFVIAQPVGEHQLMAKGNKKTRQLLQLLQALRNRKELYELRCYFLLTAYFWELKKQPGDFWEKPMCELFVHMLRTLRDYFHDGRLPHYWEPRLNLLVYFNKPDLNFYAHVLNKCCNTFQSYSNQRTLTYDRCQSHFKW